MTLAAMYRRFNFELFETDFECIRAVHDFAVPNPRIGSKGVRVHVIGEAKE